MNCFLGYNCFLHINMLVLLVFWCLKILQCVVCSVMKIIFWFLGFEILVDAHKHGVKTDEICLLYSSNTFAFKALA